MSQKILIPPLLNSKIAVGETTHTRFEPVKRTFRYDLNYLLVDIDEISSLNRLPCFHWDRSFHFSCASSDFLMNNFQSIQKKCTLFLKQELPNLKYDSIRLLTTPRWFGRSFNPVSFFFIYESSDIVAIIAEVHNTFKQKHLYLLTNNVSKNSTLRFEKEKVFHVSPFFEVDGKYDFLFSINKVNINININYKKEATMLLNAQLKLRLRDIKKFSFIKMYGQFTKTAVSTFPRILVQASVLKLFRRLPFMGSVPFLSKYSSKPSKPTLLEIICLIIFRRVMSKLTVGQLKIQLPNQSIMVFGQSNPSIQGSIEIVDYKFFTRCIFREGLGFSESYFNGFFRTDNLYNVLSILSKNDQVTNKESNVIKWYKLIRYYMGGRYFISNTIKRAKKNISEHYDLGNDFFTLFLDQSKMYSSAIFKKREESLEQAQQNKIKQIVQLGDITSKHKVLEIGSGWGSLALYLAQHVRCHVTTVTISEEQYNYVKQKINQLHLDHLIEVKQMDYRLLTGKYDRIVSIEMIEAVGHSHIQAYFNKCSKLLKNGGQAVFQCIMVPDDRYVEYCMNIDFIQRYIFPGGHLPSLEFLKESVSKANLKWASEIDITSHYSKTLLQWESRFKSNKSSIKKLGFNESFYLKWLYYFNYCAVGFDEKMIRNYQFKIQK